jgi:hypothetical protein
MGHSAHEMLPRQVCAPPHQAQVALATCARSALAVPAGHSEKMEAPISELNDPAEHKTHERVSAFD